MNIQVRRSYKMCQRYIHLYGYTPKTVVLEVPILSDRLALSGFPLVAETAMTATQVGFAIPIITPAIAFGMDTYHSR
jgi:hypothetical protein